MNRREFLASVAAAPLAAVPVEHPSALAAQASTATRPRARIKQSVMGSVWTGTNISFEERCRILARIGFKGVVCPRPSSAILKQYGLPRIDDGPAQFPDV